MALDLISLFLTTAGEFAAKKAIEVAWRCITCDAPKERERIENITYNQFYCSNCRADRRQFTNACHATVAPNGRIGQVGFSLASKWNYIERGGSLFRTAHRVGVQVPGSYYFDGLAGQSLIEINEVRCHRTGRLYKEDTTLWTVRSNFEQRDMWLNAFFDDLPKNGRELYDLDFRIENKYGDLLLRDRDVVHI
jgi:hypothetical protein